MPCPGASEGLAQGIQKPGGVSSGVPGRLQSVGPPGEESRMAIEFRNPSSLTLRLGALALAAGAVAFAWPSLSVAEPPKPPDGGAPTKPADPKPGDPPAGMADQPPAGMADQPPPAGNPPPPGNQP